MIPNFFYLLFLRGLITCLANMYKVHQTIPVHVLSNENKNGYVFIVCKIRGQLVQLEDHVKKWQPLKLLKNYERNGMHIHLAYPLKLRGCPKCFTKHQEI